MQPMSWLPFGSTQSIGKQLLRPQIQLDEELGRNPLSASESREGNTRVLCEAPLAVFFDVNEQDCSVTVWSVVYHQ